MNGFTFTRWLDEMRLANIARSDRQCAKLLGVAPNTIVNWKRDGVPERDAMRTRLACRALLHRLEPYGE